MSSEQSKKPNDNTISNTSSTGEYKSVRAAAPKKAKEAERKPSWLGRKYIKISKALGDFWVVGRYGFQLGGIAGLILGFCVGGFESIRMKSFWPLPIAMIGSAITFGSIFAISTVLRSDSSGKMNKALAMEIVYFDNIEGKYKRKFLPMVYNSRNYSEIYKNDKI